MAFACMCYFWKFNHELPFAYFRLSQMYGLYYTTEQDLKVPHCGASKNKEWVWKKVDRSAKTPNGQSIQDIVDAYFAILHYYYTKQ